MGPSTRSLGATGPSVETHLEEDLLQEASQVELILDLEVDLPLDLEVESTLDLEVVSVVDSVVDLGVELLILLVEVYPRAAGVGAVLLRVRPTAVNQATSPSRLLSPSLVSAHLFVHPAHLQETLLHPDSAPVMEAVGLVLINAALILVCNTIPASHPLALVEDKDVSRSS